MDGARVLRALQVFDQQVEALGAALGEQREGRRILEQGRDVDRVGGGEDDVVAAAR